MQADLCMLTPAETIKRGDNLASFGSYIYIARAGLGETAEMLESPSFWLSCAQSFAGAVQTVRVVEAQGLFNEATLKIDGTGLTVTQALPLTSQANPAPIPPTITGDLLVSLVKTGGPTVGQTMTLPSYQR
jgi:hypothetical protein